MLLDSRPSPGDGKRRNLSHTLLGDAGIELHPSSLAGSIAIKLGAPILESIPRFDYLPPDVKALQSLLNFTTRENQTRYSHHKLAGMEFNEDDRDLAISVLIRADEQAMKCGAVPSDDQLVKELSVHPAFVSAARDKDRPEQLRLALYQIAVLQRKAQLLSQRRNLDLDQAEQKARDDMVVARMLIDEMSGLKKGTANESSVTDEVKRMFRLFSEPASSYSQMSELQLAFLVMDTPAPPTGEHPAVEPPEEEEPFVEAEGAERIGQILVGFAMLKDGIEAEDVPPESKAMFELYQSDDYDPSMSDLDLASMVMDSVVEVPTDDEMPTVPVMLELMPEDYGEPAHDEEEPTPLVESEREARGEEITQPAIPLRPAPEPQPEQEPEPVEDLALEDEGLQAEEMPIHRLVVEEGETVCKEGMRYEEGEMRGTLDGQEAAAAERPKPKLLLPLPNIGFDQALQDMLDHHYPKYDEGNKEIPRNSLIRLCSRTIMNYCQLEMDGPGFVERFRRLAIMQTGKQELDLAVPPSYREHVDALKADRRPELAIALGVAMVESHELPQASSVSFSPTPQSESEVPYAQMLKEMGEDERRLVAAAVRSKDGCTIQGLMEFVEMHPGVRELRLNNYINSLWTESTKYDLVQCRGAMHNLYARCDLSPPTPEQKRAAVMDPQELSPAQRNMVAGLFSISDRDVDASHIQEFERWANAPGRKGEALSLWRRGKVDLYMLGNLVHKLRFTGIHDLSHEEDQLVRHFRRDSDEETVKYFSKSFRQKACDDEPNLFNPDLVKTYLLFRDLRLGSLNASARSQAELQELLDAVGIPIDRVEADLSYRDCLLIPEIVKDAKGNPAYKDPSEDSLSTIVIRKKDGSKMMLDAIFDGMGGHGQGDRASRIAKDVFETAALAGWIKSAEGVRRALVLADLAILSEQIGDLGEARLGSLGMVLKQEGGLEEQSIFRTNSMGSTAVVGFQSGSEFFVVHCGDSECRVIRDGQVIFRSESHSLGYLLRKNGSEPDAQMMKAKSNIIISALGNMTPYIDVNNENHQGYSAIWLRGGDLLALDSDGVNEPMCADHEYAIFLEQAGGNVAQALNSIMDEARSRLRKGQEYPTRCQCGTKEGKNDDRSLILRYADDGIGPYDRQEPEGDEVDLDELLGNASGEPVALVKKK